MFKINGNFVNALHVRGGNNIVNGDAAIHRNGFFALCVNRAFCARQHDVGLKACGVQAAHRVLGRLGFRFVLVVTDRQIAHQDQRNIVGALDL